MTDKKVAVFVLFIVLAFPLPIFSKSYDIFVDANYDDEGDGSESKPFKNIKDALENAQSDADIYVKNGKYEENFTLEKSVNIFGQDKKNTVIEGKIIMENGTEINNLTVSSNSPAVTIAKKADVRIEDCDIKNFGLMGVQALPGGGTLVIKNSNIYGGKGGKGVYIQEGKKIEISGNSIYDNGQEGLDVRAKVSGYISNNSITGNGESGIEFIIGSSELKISDNTIKNNGASGIASQFYTQTSKSGQITISQNTLSKNRKYGLDCALPSGGEPSSTYWSKSIELSGNTIEGNKMKPISDLCNIMQAVEGDKESEDNKISEVLISENKGVLTQEEEEVSRREEEVRAQEIAEATADKEKIKNQLSKINEDWQISQAKIDEEKNKLEKRNKFIFFIFGPDFSALKGAKLELEKMREFQRNLVSFLDETKSQEVKVEIRETIGEKSIEIYQMEKVLAQNENKFSLFGQMVKKLVDAK